MSPSAGLIIEVVSCVISSTFLFPRMSQHLPSPNSLIAGKIFVCFKRAAWPC
jgi:hypothetical protein